MVENKDTLLQHQCFVCKKCTQVKVIQAAGKVVAYREKCTQVKVIQDDAEQLYKQECAWMNDGEALLKARKHTLAQSVLSRTKVDTFQVVLHI